MEFQLTRNQQQVFNLAETSSENILVCGKPGVGKSVLIRALLETGQKNYTLAAPTGLAALNIDGKTLHSIFRLPVSEGIIDPTYENFPTDDRVLQYLKFGIRSLIIDEISMVRADTFDYIDRLLRYARANDTPFGGLQVIAIGDFFQLPPVIRPEEKMQLKKAGYKSGFVFDSFVFTSGQFKVVQLHEVLRQQGDPEFMELLDGARESIISPSHLKLLNTRVTPLAGLRVCLTATNKESVEINMAKLKALGKEISRFQAKSFGQWPAFPTDPDLSIAVGAQVIVKMNRADLPDNRESKPSLVVNGTLGIVTQIEPDRVEIEVVESKRKFKAWIYIKSWERKRKVQGEDGKWTEEIVASFTQLPLALSWAISIHKSQGQTFSEVHINANRIFADGQMYVALSRCKSLAGITLEQPVSSRKFTTNKDVLRFSNEVLELV